MGNIVTITAKVKGPTNDIGSGDSGLVINTLTQGVITDDVVTLCETEKNGVSNINVTMHYVLTNHSPSPPGSESNFRWLLDIQTVQNGGIFGPSIVGLSGVVDVEQYKLVEPSNSDEYIHYCVKFCVKNVTLNDCNILLLKFKRLNPVSEINYKYDAWIIASTICVTGIVGEGCSASIGYWKSPNGRPKQCYPRYLGTIGGLYTRIIQSISDADSVLSMPGGGYDQLSAQLLAAKFAYECNSAYIPPEITDASSVGDIFLASASLGSPGDNAAAAALVITISGFEYSATKILEMYNNSGVTEVVSENGGPDFVRTDQIPAWPDHC